MTAKEKANSLIKKFEAELLFECFPAMLETLSKNCAIIHVNGIIEEVDRIHFRFIMDNEKTRKYWQQVLNELNQM